MARKFFSYRKWVTKQKHQSKGQDFFLKVPIWSSWPQKPLKSIYAFVIFLDFPLELDVKAL